MGFPNCREKERKTSSSSWKLWDEIVCDRGGWSILSEKGEREIKTGRVCSYDNKVRAYFYNFFIISTQDDNSYTLKKNIK